MTTSNDAAVHSGLQQSLSMNPLKLLAETIEKSKKDQADVAVRLQSYATHISQLHTDLEARNTELRRVKAHNQHLEAETARLTKDNTNLLRHVQQLEAAIHMACNDFNETSTFMAEGVRSSLPSAPASVARTVPAQAVEVTRAQPVNSFATKDSAPAPAPAASTETTPAPIVSQEVDDEIIKRMMDDLDQQLANGIIIDKDEELAA